MLPQVLLDLSVLLVVLPAPNLVQMYYYKLGVHKIKMVVLLLLVREAVHKLQVAQCLSNQQTLQLQVVVLESQVEMHKMVHPAK